ncbi:uncharacterized protein LOC62_06G008751 [Vanrija pseudolonga]|uniref:Uncharacterized protein n=1 Tax=Vanrija pseudolonga TaxID=143232 RepID=A0AAF0YII0_9TREE|nr:hypothetical protein LOC62_06G008751 [Vanrija pseudolonga]
MRKPSPHDRGRSASTPIDLSDNNDDEDPIVDLTGDEASGEESDSSGAETVHRRRGKASRRRHRSGSEERAEVVKSRHRLHRRRLDEPAEVVKSRKRRSEPSSSESESDSDGGEEGGEYYFPEPRNIRYGSESGSGSDSSDSVNSDTNNRRPQSRHRHRHRARTSESESGTPPDSDDSESDDEWGHDHDHNDDPGHELPHSCPNPEQYAEVYARLRRPAVAARLAGWMRNHPHGGAINMDEVAHLVFPHPWIRRFIGSRMPRNISGVYLPLLPRLLAVAVSLFRPVRHHTTRSKAYRLRKAIEMLADDLPHHNPPCNLCKNMNIPCVDLGVWEPRCWLCKLHAKLEKTCSVIRAYRGNRRRVDAADELEAEVRQHMVVEEEGRRRRTAANALVEELGSLLDNPHDDEEKRDVLARLSQHALVEETVQERRWEADQLLRRNRNRFKRQRIVTSDEEEDSEVMLDGDESEGDDDDE